MGQQGICHEWLSFFWDSVCSVKKKKVSNKKEKKSHIP